MRTARTGLALAVIALALALVPGLMLLAGWGLIPALACALAVWAMGNAIFDLAGLASVLVAKGTARWRQRRQG
ncbi:hypothetical protein ACFFMP_05120 [Pseudoroseomonas cervicalis]|uniref:Uncharacterized protein n=1 Tax=Pseudoroseomonas cervicalis ATCC 49957 TaxID=525371 RepID=D5RKF5_9PROT|nr:hypothetical protein [Pseudoroseomonas cervicalis]EFH12211.1 hypothetical protein HMPREF0731_1565 [Pseudoroseomonas cervicalis ATCC 49957]